MTRSQRHTETLRVFIEQCPRAPAGKAAAWALKKIAKLQLALKRERASVARHLPEPGALRAANLPHECVRPLSSRDCRDENGVPCADCRTDE